MVTIVSCHSVDELLARLTQLSDPAANLTYPSDIWMFRGQSNADWPLTSTIERDDRLRPIEESEKMMLDTFRAKAHIYSSFARNELNTIDCLSLMQHHGAPTRLLDWTYAPWVATFFAAAEERPESGAVWAVNTSKVRYWANWAYQYYINKYRPEDSTDLDFTIENHEANFADENVFSTLRLSTNITGFVPKGFVAALLPSYHNPRFVNQQGVFLVNFKLDMPFQKSLEAMLDSAEEPTMYKFVFPSSIREQLLRKLMNTNIHDAVLFPDLHGLCQFIYRHRMLYPQDSFNHISP